MLRIMNITHRGMNSWFIRQGAINDGDRVLDIGCGGGKTLGILSKLNPNGIIYGIDISAQAVKESIKMNEANVASGSIIVKEASVSQIPYEDQFFDAITAFQTHYFWPSLEHDVGEVWRVLKKWRKIYCHCGALQNELPYGSIPNTSSYEGFIEKKPVSKRYI
ncbi:class I SAM-dependent methyltransferase [Lysinibacillus sp. MHQ-1]|nr:class I SAM-dependent methyltransferase [Lysinibacillus sp. MHQ-1]